MSYNRGGYGIRIYGFADMAEPEQQRALKYPGGFTDVMLCVRKSSKEVGY